MASITTPEMAENVTGIRLDQVQPTKLPASRVELGRVRSYFAGN